MKTRLTLTILISLLVMMSCNIINPAESAPSFIHIDEFVLETDFFEEGSNSNKITEIWVFEGGQMLGAYDLPADVPVLSEGPSDLTFFAGIKNNGIAATRITYPFYEPFAINQDLTALETHTVIPEFSYKESTFFRLKESFEDAGNLFIATDISDTILFNVSGEEAFEGNSSGKAVLTESNRYFQVETEDELPLPAGKQIWVEMDYKCENSMAVGLKAYRGVNITKDLALIINPTTDASGVPQWNKIYVELTFVANQHIGADFFRLYLESSLDSGNEEAELYFDNIKIVHFE